MPASRHRLWVPVVLWAALMFTLSSIPSLGTGLGPWDLALRKLGHAAEYAILGAMLMRAIARPGVAVAVGAAYAVSDEVHQHFVRGRNAAWYDVLIDWIGLTIGVMLWQRARRRARSL